MKKILICYGTRPEWIKIKPIVKKIEGVIPHKLLFTGQHKDLVTTNADFNLEMNTSGNNRLDTIIESCMNLPDIYFKDISHVLIQGDTTSVLALALASFHRKIKIIHLEAGLRTYNLDHPYPEEINRQLVSRIASIHLCPTFENKQNLINEKVNGIIYIVGNTVLDSLIHIKPFYSNKILITLHRRENHNIMDKWFKEIDKLAKKNLDLEFILPIHPNPNVQKHRHLLKYVKIVDPIIYEKMIDLLAECKFIITDSGGIQEEASFLNKRCIVCRKVTERPEALLTHNVLCKYPSGLKNLFESKLKNYKVNNPCPFGDGHSSERIIKILKNEIKKHD